ncbi:MAG: hypothetical protein WC515_00560 [Candidatus Omnitrophota bacterium]
MIIKKKSMIVAVMSSVVISIVLVMTLIAYLTYIELKGEEFRRSYQVLLQKVNARVYARHLEISGLDARIEASGPLKGKPVIEGSIKNNGSRGIDDIILKVRFLDSDGAILYEATFHPQDPPLGASALQQVAIPYLTGHSHEMIRPGSTFPFKAIMADCPPEMLMSLRKDGRSSKVSGAWSGRLSPEVIAMDF